MLRVARANDGCAQLGLPHNLVRLEISARIPLAGRSPLLAVTANEVKIGAHKLGARPATLARERLPSHAQTQ